MLKLFVWTDDVDDPFEVVDRGILGVVLLPFTDDAEGLGWVEVTICPN